MSGSTSLPEVCDRADGFPNVEACYLSVLYRNYAGEEHVWNVIPKCVRLAYDPPDPTLQWLLTAIVPEGRRVKDFALKRCDFLRIQPGDTTIPVHKGRAVFVFYRNWRGDERTRNIIPLGTRFGSSSYHPKPQWILSAIDPEDGIIKDFALKDCNFLGLHRGRETIQTADGVSQPAY